jgi:SAM-dependent methyltransferase
MTTGSGPDLDLHRVYGERFDPGSETAKHELWRPIASFLQRYVDDAQPLIDIASDHGYFVHNIRASERWASDVRDMSGSFPPSIRFVRSDGLALADVVPTDHFGTVFMSNYLEHLRSGEEVVEQLHVARRLLRPGGRVIVLQPNVRLIGGSYWDFIDHRVALTDRSLEEAGTIAGLRTVELISRFLPYTTRGAMPTHPRLVRLYLATRPAWWLLGKQTLWVAEGA